MSRPHSARGRLGHNVPVTLIDNAVYVDGRRVFAPTSLSDTWDAIERTGGMAWLGLYRPHPDELQEVADELPLHPLAVEDALTPGQRAKLERYGDDWFMVLHPARYIDATETVEFGELDVFTGKDYVVTVRHAEEPDLADIRAGMEQRHTDRLAQGPSQVAFEILDHVVDAYFPVAEGLEQDIREIEDQIFSGDAAVSRRIYELSREIIGFERATRPLPRMIEQLQEDMRARLGDAANGSHASHLEAPEPEPGEEERAELVETLRALRDIHDHAVQVTDRVAAMRQMLENALELDSTLASKRLAEQSIAQNEQVKRISSWAAIIFAPQLIGSVYGMNFQHMPELEWPLGYPWALGLMLGVAVALYALFKKADWL